MECELIIKILSCKEHLGTLTIKVKEKTEVVLWFQGLCEQLSELLFHVTDYVKANKPLDVTRKERMLLYLLQLNSVLSVLIKIFITENETYTVITEARRCIVKQLSACLDGLEAVLTGSEGAERCDDGFVKFMDATLDKVADIEIEKGAREALDVCEQVRPLIEEVLCHGMSIAQVALKDDCAGIKGTSKEVLHTLESLCQQIAKPEPNVAMCNLFVDSLCDKLCQLERKVNTSVLKLSLKVFSECTRPLEDLHRFCLKGADDGGGGEELLDELVADFDLHVDQMIQIGLFAIACSTNTACTLKIRSCLASLEALEAELVPSFTTMRNDPTPQKLYFASILKYYWIRQALALKKYIYLIIDPFAFCQVTYEIIRDINDDLEERFRTAEQVDKSLVKPITLQSKILYEMLTVSVKDSPPDNEEVVRKYLNDVINVTMEIDAATEKLLQADKISKDNMFRVFKRCKVQESVLRRLLRALRDDTAANDRDKATGDAETARAATERTALKDEVIDRLVIRGKQILKDRSVLYKTPAKSTNFHFNTLTKGNKSLPLSRLVHKRNVKFSQNVAPNETSIDLQITEILDNLTTLSASFAGHS